MELYIHLLNHINTFPKVHAKYIHAKEKNINPAYCDIDNCDELCTYEKRIWVLRSDLILAVGIKNSPDLSICDNILNSFNQNVHSFIDLNDRYGHPSLAIKDEDYDGTVYYAGWLSQQNKHLEIFLHTGRYQNDELTVFQRQHLERYIALKFMQAYGEQPVIFIDWIRNSGTSDRFFKGKSLASQNEQRIYSPLSLEIKNRLLYLQVEEKFDSVQLSQIYNNNGEALLHQAVIEGHIELILYLIAEGVDLNVVTSTTHTLYPNMTALDIAIHCTQYYAAMLLVDAGAQINEPITGSDPLIHLALKHGLFDLVQSLHRKNSNLIFAIDLDDQRLMVNKYKKRLREKDAIRDKNGIAPLFAILEQVLNNSDIDIDIYHVIYTLYSLAEDSIENQNAIREGIPSLIALLKDSRSKEATKEYILKTLYILSHTDKDSKTIIGEKGFIELLVAIPNDINLRTETKESALDLLADICIHNKTNCSTIQNVIRETGSILTLVNLLTHKNSRGIQREVILALININYKNTVNQNTFRNAEGIPALVTLLNMVNGRLIKSAEVVCAAVVALKIIVDENTINQNALHDAEGIPALVALLDYDNIDAHHVISTLCAVAAKNAANQDAIYTAGGILPLLALFGNSSTKLIKILSLCALINLLENEQCKKAIPDIDFRAELNEFLQSSADDLRGLAEKSLAILTELEQSKVSISHFTVFQPHQNDVDNTVAHDSTLKKNDL